MPTKRLLVALLVQLSLLLGLGLASGYQIPDLKNSNWMTVLFLTPKGIITNHLDPMSVLQPYYSERSEGQIPITPQAGGIMVTLYLAIIANALFYLRAPKRDPKREPKREQR